MTSDRKWEEGRQTDSVGVLLWIYWGGELVFGGWRGQEGGEGGSPALLLVHLRSGCVINGQSRQISRGSAVLRGRRGGKVKKGEKRGGICVRRKNTTVCRCSNCTGRDQPAPCYDWALWVILSRRLQQRGDDSFWDRGSEVMWLSAGLYREHQLSVNLLLWPERLSICLVVWAVTGHMLQLPHRPSIVLLSSVQDPYLWSDIFDLSFIFV